MNAQIIHVYCCCDSQLLSLGNANLHPAGVFETKFLQINCSCNFCAWQLLLQESTI